MNESDPAQPVLPEPTVETHGPGPGRPRRHHPLLGTIAWLVGAPILSIILLIGDSWIGDRSLTGLETIGIPALITLIASIRITRGRSLLPRVLLVGVLWVALFIATFLLLAIVVAIAISGSQFAAVG